MRKLAAKTLDQIEHLITTTDTKSSSTASRSKITKQEDTSNKTPLKEKQNNTPRRSVSPKHYKNIHDYHPLQKQNKFMQRQVEVLYDELDYQHTHQVQNQRSLFLNSKNPRPPIHERALHIIEEREMILQQKRREMQRLKQQKEQQQYQKLLAETIPKKVMNKSQVYELSERLYKEQYSKLNRLNQQKMERFKKQTEIFREKPEISQTSKVLYRALKGKDNLENDVIDRFEKYNKEKLQKQAEMQKTYKQKYFPFKPMINENSKLLLTSAKTDRSDTSNRKNCNSCIWLKNQKSHLNLAHSPKKSPFKKTFQKQSSLKISHLH